MTSSSAPSRTELLVLIHRHNRYCRTSDTIPIKLSRTEQDIVESIYQHDKERRSKYCSLQLAVVDLMKHLQKVEKLEYMPDAINTDWDGALKSCRKVEVQMEHARKHAENWRLKEAKKEEEELKEKKEAARRSDEAAKKKEKELRKKEEVARKSAEWARKEEAIKKRELAKNAGVEPHRETLEHLTRPDDNKKGKEKEIDTPRLKVHFAPRDRSRSPELSRAKEFDNFILNGYHIKRDHSRSPEPVGTKEQDNDYIKSWASKISGNRARMPGPANFNGVGETESDVRLEIPQVAYGRRARSRSPSPIFINPGGPLEASTILKRDTPNVDLRKETSDDNFTVQIGKITRSEKGRRVDAAYEGGLRLASEVRKF